MKVELKNGEAVVIRSYKKSDFQHINHLNEEEGWSNLVAKSEHTREAWEHSNVAFVVEGDRGNILGYIRGITDTKITLYVCELLVAKAYRGTGMGRVLLNYVHHLYPETRIDLLGSSTSKSFYEGLDYRPFYGFRKTIHE